MATRSRPSPVRKDSDRTGVNVSKIGAIIAQICSWFTTYWCVEWIVQPPPADIPLIIGVSIVIEVLLILMKRLLFDSSRGNDAIGWTGFILDALINAGGIVERAGRLLTFPLVKVFFDLVAIDVADPFLNKVGAVVIALVVGSLLSVLPHRLWKGD